MLAIHTPHGFPTVHEGQGEEENLCGREQFLHFISQYSLSTIDLLTRTRVATSDGIFVPAAVELTA